MLSSCVRPREGVVGDAAHDDELADQKLALWGKLRAGTHYFLDGGILDNKPFTKSPQISCARSTLESRLFGESKMRVARTIGRPSG